MTTTQIPTEIERKFLVHEKDVTNIVKDCKGVDIVQGYLGEDGPTVRVRLAKTKFGKDAWLTIKGKAEGLAKPEFEYSIPVEHAEWMLKNMCGTRVIKKTRYLVEMYGRTFEVDYFKGNLKGLVMMEIEFTEDNPLPEDQVPMWVRREVTDDKQYKNKKLAKSQCIPKNYEDKEKRLKLKAKP